MKKFLFCAFTSLSIAPVYAESGNVELIGTNILNFSHAKAGDDVYSVSNFDSMAVVKKSSFNPLKENDFFGGKCSVSNKTINNETTLEGICVLKDESGDSFALHVTRTGVIGLPGKGIQKFKGLTGKFANMTGNCTYAAKYVKNDVLFGSVLTICNMNN